MFDAAPDKIQAGGKAKLVWQTENADSVSIEPEVGAKKPSGSVSVSPSKDTKYTLIAKNAAGSKTQELTITVEAAKAEAKPAASVAAAAPGDDARTIKELIEQRWKSALEGQNLGEAKSIWPSIPKDSQNLVKSIPRGTRISFSCSPTVSGDNAEASCSESVTVGGKSNQTTVRFALVKTSGTWLIQNSR